MTETPPNRADQQVAQLRSAEPETSGSSMRINLEGGRLESLVLNGQELLFSGTRIDGGTGSTHLCSPNFGPDKVGFGLPNHGPGRDKKTKWTVIKDEPEHVIQSYVIGSGEVSAGNYPSGMEIIQDYKLVDGGLKIITTHTNNGDTEAPVNSAMHFYWATLLGLGEGDKGWEGVKVNGIDVSDKIKEDTALPWKDENIIEIPGRSPILVKQKGLPYFQCWTAEKDGEFDRKFAALEPAEGPEKRFGTPESMIKPGDSRTTEIFVQVQV